MMGYSVLEMSIQPGGFTIFTFKPSMTHGNPTHFKCYATAGNLVLVQILQDQQLSSTLPNMREYYLTKSLKNLQIQLERCIRFLDLLNTKLGLASEGCSKGPHLIQANKSVCHTLFRMTRCWE
jgi:hypothetical protein